MTDREFQTEQVLRDLYYNPEQGYSSSENLYQRAKEGGLSVSRKKISEWLKEQRTYSKFKPLRRPPKYRRVFVKSLGEQLQMDLVDMQKFKGDNYDHYWILTAIEILSRYAFAVPILRKDTQSMTDGVTEVLEDFGKRFGRLPEKVQFDEGGEFYNVGVKELFDDLDIVYFSSSTGRKASVVERFNRTLKTRMWKYFDAEGTREWVSVLDQFVDGYNSSVNRSIKMRPEDVDEDNSKEVFTTLYGYGSTGFGEAKYEVGDRVRIHRYKNTFAKGFEANFTEEVFTVSVVDRGDPNMYRITGEDGEAVKGRFYKSEMSLYTGGPDDDGGSATDDGDDGNLV